MRNHAGIVAGESFARDIGIPRAQVPHESVVATQFAKWCATIPARRSNSTVAEFDSLTCRRSQQVDQWTEH
jgi:hypothetical protein